MASYGFVFAKDFNEVRATVEGLLRARPNARYGSIWDGGAMVALVEVDRPAEATA